MSKEATHFLCTKRSHRTNGYFITLYKITKGQFNEARPKYLSPLGWVNHQPKNDKRILDKLIPIQRLEEFTGDDIEKNQFDEYNLYAG